jgi:predicted alpha/beta hydrolase
LPERGFNVFVFDYRGYGASEGSPGYREVVVEFFDAALSAR